MSKIIQFLSSPLNVTYLTLVILGIALIIYGIIGNSIYRSRSILKRISNSYKGKNPGIIDVILDKIPYITEKEKRFDKKVAVLDVNYNARTFTKLDLLCALLAVLASIHFKNVLTAIPLLIIFTNVPITFLEMKINKRIKLYNDQVLDAFQIFVTDYTTTKSVQKTIANIGSKLKYPLRKEFERLGRKLNSGEPFEECFLEFAQRTQNKWTMIFSQMMITYFRNGGEFTNQLFNITKSITNEKVLAEHNNTELLMMRILNIVMNALVPVAYISNKFINPSTARVFINEPTGRKIMVYVVTSCLVSLYMGKKITES